MQELITAVEEAFAVTGRGLPPWPDPHRDRAPEDDEYSRVSDPYRWRIVGARADAWVAALADAGLVETIEADPDIEWEAPPGTLVSSAIRVVPRATGALPLIIARNRIADVDDVGITLGVGHPAIVCGVIPYCGCDACDDGSQMELDQVDQSVLGVVTGEYRRLRKGSREITVVSRHSRHYSGSFRPGEAEAVLDRPHGWREISGASWFGER